MRAAVRRAAGARDLAAVRRPGASPPAGVPCVLPPGARPSSCSTSSTGSCWPAAATSTRRSTAPTRRRGTSTADVTTPRSPWSRAARDAGAAGARRVPRRAGARGAGRRHACVAEVPHVLPEHTAPDQHAAAGSDCRVAARRARGGELAAPPGDRRASAPAGRVTASADDGIVEAVEWDGTRPGRALGVQWHPEMDATGPALFGWLVAASAGRRASRARATLV